MRGRFLFAGVLWTTACAALAQQPTIRPNSVVNAASYAQPGLPNYGVAQGGMFILKGQNLGASGIVTASAFPLQTTMGGTSMQVTTSGGSFDVLMVYVVAGQASLVDEDGQYDQLAGIVPSNVPPGQHLINVTYNGKPSQTQSITVVPNAFGIFSINQGGTGPGVFTDANYKPNTLINVAHAGDQMFIWGTGLGAISGGDANQPPVGNLNVPVEVYVGNVKASIGYQGRSGCCAGIDQILITIPPGVTGCYVPVAVKTGNIVSNFATMSIEDSGTVCSDPAGFSTADLAKLQSGAALNRAEINLSRISLNISLPGMNAIQGDLDQGEGHFRNIPPSALPGIIGGAVAAFRGFPSVGCNVIPYTPPSQQLFNNFLKGTPDPGFNSGDAGPVLNFTGPNGLRQILKVDDGGPAYELGGNTFLGGGAPPLVPAAPGYLSPGNYTLDDGTGGPSVGAFKTTLTIPATQATWTNEAPGSTIPRSQGLTITVNSSGPGPVAVQGNSSGTQAGAALYCVEPAGTTSFIVPSWVLSALPASAQASDLPAPMGFLGVGTALSSPSRFQASGVDSGTFNWGELQITNVNFQ